MELFVLFNLFFIVFMCSNVFLIYLNLIYYSICIICISRVHYSQSVLLFPFVRSYSRLVSHL